MLNINLVEIIDNVAKPINERIDKACKKYQRNKVQVEHMPIIPGVDTTGGGRYLTFDENERNLKKQGNIITHREAAKKAFAHVPCTIMPWKTFHGLCKELKVMIIHPNQGNSTKYRIPLSWRKSVTEKVSKIDHDIQHKKSIVFDEVLVYFQVAGLFLVLCLFLAIAAMTVGTNITVYHILGVCIAIVGLVRVRNYFTKKSLDTLRHQKESIISDATNLHSFFPNCIIKNPQIVYPRHSRPNSLERRKIDEMHSKDFVTITVPNPKDSNNPKVIDKINRAFAPHHLKDFLERDLTTVMLVADVNALGVEQDIKPFTELQPIKRVSEPNNFDPGIVVRYGTMVVILSELFWNLTDVEEDFYARAMRVGESFDVERYILN